MELADIVLVTKADGELKPAAARAASDYAHALHLMRPKYQNLPPQVMQVSALEGQWHLREPGARFASFHDALRTSGQLKKLREEQLRSWFWNESASRSGRRNFRRSGFRATSGRCRERTWSPVANCRMAPPGRSSGISAVPDRPPQNLDRSGRAPYESRSFGKSACRAAVN